MKEEILAYLSSIESSSVVNARVEEIVNIYNDILDEEIDEIFISEYVNEEGHKVLENLLLFTDRLVMEAKQFLTSEDFDIVLYKGSIKYINWKSTNFNYKESTGSSRFFVHLSMNGNISCDIKGSGNNSKFLYDLIKRRLVTNVNK